MKMKKMSAKPIAVLLALGLCLAMLSTAVFAEGSRTQVTDDRSVDTSTTQVIGVLQTDRATYENAFSDDTGWTSEDGETYEKYTYNSGKTKVDYTNPCSEEIQGKIDAAKNAVDALGENYDARPNLSYAGADTGYSDRVTDNRSYRWLSADEVSSAISDAIASSMGDDARYMLITGDYGRERVYRIVGVIASSDEPDAHTHSGVAVPEVPATAEAEGRKAHYECSCGKRFGDEACTDEVTAADLVIPKLAPTLLAGDNGKFTKGGEEGLSFKSSAALDDLVSVSADGAVIGEANYTKASGSTVITLTPEYLNTLSVGEHTLTITSNTGAVNARFAVEEQEKAPAASDGSAPAASVEPTPDTTLPQTGDNGDLLLWVMLLMVGGMVAAAAAVCIGRKRRAE